MSNLQSDPEFEAGAKEIESFLVTEMAAKGFTDVVVTTKFDADALRVQFSAAIDDQEQTLVVIGWEDVVDSHAGLLENTKLRILNRLAASTKNLETGE